MIHNFANEMKKERPSLFISDMCASFHEYLCYNFKFCVSASAGVWLLAKAFQFDLASTKKIGK